MASMSAREFNQNVSRATRIARDEPVFISSRGSVEYVLIGIEEYRKLQGGKETLFDALHMPEAADIDFDSFIPPRRIEARDSDFD